MTYLLAYPRGPVSSRRRGVGEDRSLRALVLTGCFFPPARNERSTPATVADYARHRAAFVREYVRRGALDGPRRGR